MFPGKHLNLGLASGMAGRTPVLNNGAKARRSLRQILNTTPRGFRGEPTAGPKDSALTAAHMGRALLYPNTSHFYWTPQMAQATPRGNAVSWPHLSHSRATALQAVLWGAGEEKSRPPSSLPTLPMPRRAASSQNRQQDHRRATASFPRFPHLHRRTDARPQSPHPSPSPPSPRCLLPALQPADRNPNQRHQRPVLFQEEEAPPVLFCSITTTPSPLSD